MNNKWFKLSSILVLGAYLAACTDASEEEGIEEDTELVEDVEETEDHDHESEDHDHNEEEAHEDEEAHDHDHDHGSDDVDVPETVEIEGVEHHYHTGELVELMAVLDEEVEYDDWHWYIREDDDAEWEMVSGQNTEEFVGEAPEESFEIRAVLYDDAHEAYAQSPATEIEVDNH